MWLKKKSYGFTGKIILFREQVVEKRLKKNEFEKIGAKQELDLFIFDFLY